MAEATSLTADRMIAIEGSSVTNGSIDGDGNLILSTKGGATINAGHVVGEDGPQGDKGNPGQDAVDTGYVTDLVINTGAPNWSIVRYRMRKQGAFVQGTVLVQYGTTGAAIPAITAGADGNISDINALVVLPAGWQNASGENVMTTATLSGYATWGARCNGGSGNIDLTHGPYPGCKIIAGNQLYVDVKYWSN